MPQSKRSVPKPPSRGKEPNLSSREVAILLDLSPDDVNDLARRGELPGFKQGRFWKFRRTEVLRALNVEPLCAAIRKAAPAGDRVRRDGDSLGYALSA